MKIRRWICAVLLFVMLLGLIPAEALAKTAAEQTQETSKISTPSGMSITSQTDYTIYSGVTETQVKLTNDGKPLTAFVTTVSSTAKAAFKVSYPGYYAAGSTASSRAANIYKLPLAVQKTTAQAAAFEKATGQKVLYATNGSFFDSAMVPRGHLIMEGNVIQPGFHTVKEPYFALLKDGTYAIRDYTESYHDVQEAVGARHWLVKNGKNVVTYGEDNEHSSLVLVVHPRSAIGLKADGSVVSMVVDGRNDSYSVGVTLSDLADMMIAAGCVTAVNLDGGGSSTFASVRNGSGTLTIRNKVTDSTGERSVTSALLLVSTADQCAHTYKNKNYKIYANGTHGLLCDSCNVAMISEHRYTSGKCACGDVQTKPSYLYFDFNNDTEDRDRYINEAYGYHNFDLPTLQIWRRGLWATKAVSTTANVVNGFTLDNSSGTLNVQVADGQPYGDANNYGPWVVTTSAYRQFPNVNDASSLGLKYDPSQAEVVQIRFKVKGCTKTSTADPRVVVVYDHTTDSTTARGDYTMISSYALQDGVYQTLTIPVSTKFKSADYIRSFGFRFWDLKSTGSGQVTIDYIYVGPREELPTQKHLFFDFDNSVQAQNRYLNKTYTGTMFDRSSKGYWATMETSTTSDTVYTDFSINNSAGTLSVKVAPGVAYNSGNGKYGPWITTTASYGTYPGRTASSLHPLSYDPSSAEVIQIRFKTTNCVLATSSAAQVVVVYDYFTGSGTTRGAYDMVKSYTLSNGTYQTLTIPVTDAFKNAQLITTFGLRFWHIKGNGTTGNVVIDYIYVGPEAGVPEQDRLVFGFGNADKDQIRYSSKTYGEYNFDRGYWAYQPKRSTAPIYGTNTVSIKIAPTTTNYDSDGVSPYIQTTDSSMSLKNSALNYKPGAQDYVQIRFKMENCAVESGLNPAFRLYYDTTGTGTMAGYANHNIPAEKLTAGTYFVLTQKLYDKEAYTSASQIESVRMAFNNVHSVSGKTGVITVDYLYIGPKSGLPTPQYTVTFKNADGTVLATQLVHKGETAAYSGASPKKAADKSYHYTFKGWDKACTNITANTTITAQFTATAHSFSLQSVSSTQHKKTCKTCAYSETVSHSFTYSATTDHNTHKRSCSCGYSDTTDGHAYTFAKYSSTQHTRSCSKCGFVDQANHIFTYTTTGATQHKRYCNWCKYEDTVNHTWNSGKVTKAATCTATGVKTYTCTASGCGATKTETIAKLSHSYSYKVSKSPTTSATGTLTGTCSACSGTTTVTLPKLNTTDYSYKVTKAATCAATGTGRYTWKTTSYGTFNFDVTIAKTTSHSYNSGSITTQPTCTAAGVKTYTCTVCKATKTEAVAAKGHTVVTDKAVAATCTTAGKTEGSHCSVCNAVMKAQQSIPATGHSYDNGVVTTAPTLTATGVRTFTCKNNSSHSYTETLNPLHKTLLIDYNNLAADVSRYQNYTYGFHNFDDGMNLHWISTGAAPVIDNKSGVLQVSPKASVSSLVLRTAETSDITGTPLHYDLTYAEVFQLRMKMENFALASGKTPLVTLDLYSNGKKIDLEDQRLTQEQVSSGQYFVVTIPLTDAERSYGTIDRIEVYMGNFSGDANSKATIDYIYIGTENETPTPRYTVTFRNEDGTILASQKVHHGEQAQYTGVTPQKAYDSGYHYSFVGWDRSLSNITSHTTITAKFTATAHSFRYSKQDSGKHTATCDCGFSKIEDHAFVNGCCLCGEEELQAPIQNDSFKIYHSLNLASDISVNYVVFASDLEGFDMDTVYLECKYMEYEGNVETEEVKVRLQPVLRDGNYYFTLTGLTSVHMSNRLQAVLYGTKGRQPYYSATDNYSIGDYAYSQLNKANSSKELKTLCADLLRYGAAAQTYKAYRTDVLVDAAMTATHKSYLSNLDSVVFGNNSAEGTELTSPVIKWTGKALDLNTKVTVLYVIDARSYEGNPKDLTIQIHYNDLSGRELTATLRNPELYANREGYYCYRFDGLTAAELRSVLTATVYDGNTPISNSLTYSPDTYGNGKTGTLGNLCKALIAYSDSAKAYFLS